MKKVKKIQTKNIYAKTDLQVQCNKLFKPNSFVLLKNVKMSNWCAWWYLKTFVNVFLQGQFTAEEDAIIAQKVLEWGNKGRGLWVELEKELCRPIKNIRAHWNTVLSNSTHNTLNQSNHSSTQKEV